MIDFLYTASWSCRAIQGIKRDSVVVQNRSNCVTADRTSSQFIRCLSAFERTFRSLNWSG